MDFIIPLANNVLEGYTKKSPCQSVCKSECLVNEMSLTDTEILMILDTVALYDLRMCMKEDNHGLKYFKGDVFN